MSLEGARAVYEPLVAAGLLRDVPATGVVAHRLVGSLEEVPVCAELTEASGGGVRVVRRTRFFSPLPSGVSMGFALLPRRDRPAVRGDVAARFAGSFNVEKRKWRAFVSSGIDRPAMAAVLAFLDAHGGLLTIGPDLISWQTGGLDVPGQGETLARAFARMAASLQSSLRRGSPAGQTWPEVDAAYIAARADAPEPVMYLSEEGLLRLFVALTVLGLVALAGGILLGGAKGGRNFLVILALFLLVPGVGGASLLAWQLSSVRPALLP